MVVYFTATFPYVVLLILLIRNCMLDGAIDGIEFYIIPEWEKLKDVKVWHAAASQIFYSLGVAFGGLATMASYNRFHNNILRDAIVVSVINCATSVFGGFVIFAVIGFMAKQTNQRVEDVATSGPGLLFIAYPEGLAMMPVAPLWSILFFLMVFTLGLDSQFANMETIISAIVDEVKYFQTGKRKGLLTGGVCILLFLIGLPQCARNGVYIMTLFDWYCAGYALMVTGFLEVVAISWVYGYKRFSDDIHMMIGRRPNYYWLANWLFITPAFLLFILFYAAYDHTDAYYYSDQVFPDWFQAVGWLMVAASVLFIPALALVEYCKAHGFCTTMRKVTSPLPCWGPALTKFRTGRYAAEYSIPEVDELI